MEEEAPLRGSETVLAVDPRLHFIPPGANQGDAACGGSTARRAVKS
jgi:hypothetical protein